VAEERQSDATWNNGLEGTALRIASSDATPLRVTAGPGTGKTFTLMRRVARLLEEGVEPERILVISFTRTASRDLTNEISRLDVDGVKKVASGTLHSHCYKTLMKGSVLALTKRVARTLLPFELRHLEEDLKIPISRPIAACRRMRWAFEADWARLQHEEPGWPLDPADKVFHRDLLDWLVFHQAMLIGELPTLLLTYFRQNPVAVDGREFDHVLVDEYQDLNRADQVLIDLIAESGTLTVVGDEDQSIYGRLRYAQPEGIRDFALHHEHTVSESLEVCRRCPAQVVMMANSLISENRGREPRELVPHAPSKDGFVRIVQWPSMEQEAEGLAKFVRQYLGRNDKMTPHDVLILTPRRQHGLMLKMALTKEGVPAVSHFFEQSLEHAFAQEQYTLLNLVVNPDDHVSLRCWMGFGHGAMGTNPYSQLRKYCQEQSISPTLFLQQLAAEQVKIKRSGWLQKRWSALKIARAGVEDLVGQELVDKLFPEGQVATSELRQIGLFLIECSDNDVTPKALLDAIHDRILNPEPVEADDQVRIMSLYKAKGLTVKLAIIAGASDSWIPSIEEDVEGDEYRRQMEEERRLFYVVVTRPTDALVISSFMSMPNKTLHGTSGRARTMTKGRGFGSASPFIAELGPAAPRPISGKTLLT
jgi:superfamily I DNA/RNA helicase